MAHIKISGPNRVAGRGVAGSTDKTLLEMDGDAKVNLDQLTHDTGKAGGENTLHIDELIVNPSGPLEQRASATAERRERGSAGRSVGFDPRTPGETCGECGFEAFRWQAVCGGCGSQL